MSYKGSTQVKSWIFTKQELEQQRNSVNNAFCESLKAASGVSDTSNLVTPYEEQQLLFHYKKMIMQIGQQMNLPDAVYILLEEISDGSQSQAGNESLPLYGLLLDINDLVAGNQHSKWLNSSTFTFETIYEAAKKFVLKSVVTDCCFLYHPYQIALACLDLAWPPFSKLLIKSKKDEKKTKKSSSSSGSNKKQKTDKQSPVNLSSPTTTDGNSNTTSDPMAVDVQTTTQ
ncbi:hypothetical protein PPL_05605 [Heterostelium album PN500]|uniref:Cyclin C-terminal domain-containing protein n=1 Tax=Heterostelium pallidum (strain ATCC 26659 / Pp 5 / PN500) TaxID=670386 RepID=D3BAM7_HETP5|nr:hypothetical protein PPL_05605 [Heterostelium album PN500]EFA81614.1 hypothetical protein PPL_05605 [Heterostelium album PN500]|eukprot:XP_020433731.1 hypothetical protein PPL_05605 [Heterostelium album PN500]